MLKIHRTRLSQGKLSRISWLGLAGTVSCCALVLVFGLMLFPSLPQATYAAPEPTPSTGTSVGINLPASIDFDSVTPTPDGATTTATADLTVTTTNSASYSLYLYSSDGDNSLRPKISSLANISTINATAGDVGLTLSSLEPNTWGYNLGTEAPTDSTTYSAVPTDNSTPIQTKDTSDTNSANDTYTLSFGAKVDTSIPSGAYSNTLIIAVVAEPPYIPAFSGITTMQEMTSTICAYAEENETTRLTDTRDGKQYWVAKLKDGNCWMTQNLDLDLSINQPLTPENSDVISTWYPPRTTEDSAAIGSNSPDEFYSWDLGDFILSTPTAINSCGANSSIIDLSYCVDVGFVPIGNMVAMDSINKSGSVVVGNTYDAHYTVGNYYQWNTVTAGSSEGQLSNEQADFIAPSSICPKGWKLPISNSLTANGSFGYLLSQYGLASTITGIGVDAQNYDIALAPLYFVRGGYVYYNSSSPMRAVINAGIGGYYWSSVAGHTRGGSYNLDFSTGVIPSMHGGAVDGTTIRCIAR